MSKKNLTIAIVITLLSLLWCFAPWLIARCAAAEAEPEQQKYISVPMQQWNALKKNTQMLDANLILLEQNLTAQEQQSAELMNLLTEARNELQKTQQALRTATEYTQKLKKQIEAERDAAAEAKERAYWKGWLNGFCCGIAGGVIAIATK